MTKPISGESALVPRRREEQRYSKSWMDEEAVDNERVAGYAPQAAEWQARVRRLSGEGDEDRFERVEPVGDEPTSSGGVEVISAGENKLVLKIEAEVTVLGKLPAEGVAVETITLLRTPHNHNGAGGSR